MNDVFFTSDQHFGHTGVLGFNKRPFKDLEGMHELLIENHNKTVKPGDLIYHLGDFAWADHNKFLKRLKGNNYLIKGNHDHVRRLKEPLKFLWVKDTAMLKVQGQLIFLSHYAHRVWPQSHYGSWHLYGHSHGDSEDLGRSTDVGVDSWDYLPVSFDTLKERFKDRENTQNHGREHASR